jgi:hypothetical protein
MDKKVPKLNEFRCHSPPSELYSRGLRCSFTGIQQAYTDLTYSKKQSRSWAINRFSASQEIARVLWNPKVHHRVCKSLPATCSYPEPVHAIPFHILKIHLVNSLPTAVSEYDLYSYMLLTFHVPNLKFLFHHLGRTKGSVQACGTCMRFVTRLVIKVRSC